jgi:CBS domain-containing protein
MRVGDLMTENVRTCRIDDTLSRAAQIMWENDCGTVVVVVGTGTAVAMITDRDICMAAYTQGEPLSRMRVSSACSHGIFAVYEDDPLEKAEELMCREQVRRLPVIDRSGRPVGLISLNDLARGADHTGDEKELSAEALARTLAAVSRPGTVRTAPTSSVSP